MLNHAYDWLEKSLDTIRKADWYRSEQTISGLSGAVINLEGEFLLNFASNDYLGLAGDKRLIDAAITATQNYGTGSTGSRLTSGHRQLHRELEEAIAAWKQAEDALVFSSGYLANLGAITSLMGQRDVILGDEYNHSSLKNGAKLSQAQVIDFKHGDMEELRSSLAQNRNLYRRCLISTDTVFSMDGDICQLPELVNIAAEFECMLLVDEAHATGVIGETGAGCVEYFGYSGSQIVQIGTLSKALGSLGGYVAGSSTLIDFLRNRAPTWIYTTGLSPADTSAALAAIEIIREEKQLRQQLWRNVNLLKKGLSGLNILPTRSPIICLGLESPKAALEMAKKLKQGGIFAPAIRPPTVPTSRIRFSVMATHQESHIEQLVDVVKKQ